MTPEHVPVLCVGGFVLILLLQGSYLLISPSFNSSYVNAFVLKADRVVFRIVYLILVTGLVAMPYLTHELGEACHADSLDTSCYS